MEAFEECPDEEYVLQFQQARPSGRVSVVDSKGSKSGNYKNFDAFIAAQARQENKENIADTQARVRKHGDSKSPMGLKSGHNVVKSDRRRVISSRNKIGMGKLC